MNATGDPEMNRYNIELFSDKPFKLIMRSMSQSTRGGGGGLGVCYFDGELIVLEVGKVLKVKG